MIPFPGFNEESFPLVLIKEEYIAAIFNVRLIEYIKVTDTGVNTFNTAKNFLCFLEKEDNLYVFITCHRQEKLLSKFVIPSEMIQAALGN